MGASVGVFALLGVLLAHAARSGKVLPPHARNGLVIQVLFIVGLNVVLGLIAGFIDTAAHIGGLVGGLALGVVLRARGTLIAAASPAPDASVQQGCTRFRVNGATGWDGWAQPNTRCRAGAKGWNALLRAERPVSSIGVQAPPDAHLGAARGPAPQL